MLLSSFLSACKPRLVMGTYLSSRIIATTYIQRKKVGKTEKEHVLKAAVASYLLPFAHWTKKDQLPR